MYSLGGAARATGKAKSTISRDVKHGRISAVRNADGSLSIDPAELHRVYAPVLRSNGAGNGASNDSQPVPATELLVEQLRAQMAERDRLAEEQATTIRDLRQRLDAESAERREVQRRLTALLTYRQAGSVPAVSDAKASWWQRWWR